MNRALALLVIVACTPLLRAEPDKPAFDPKQPYRAERLNPVTYEVDFAVVVTAPAHTKVLKVWLPMPPSNGGQEITEGELSSFPDKVEPRLGAEPTYGNRFAFFEFHHPEGAQIIRHKFTLKVWELRWNVDRAKVVRVAKWPEGFEPYLRSDRAVVVDDRFRKLADEITKDHRQPGAELSEVMKWIEKNMTYDHAHASLQASSEFALGERRGHCSDYHGLCTAFSRALGYPARVTYGMNAFPKNSPSHCKAEVFLPPYGWVSFDVSETQRLMKTIQADPKLDESRKRTLVAAAQSRLMSGFRDNTWFLQTRGTDYDLAPPAKKRVHVVRTAYVEADGVALPEPDPANPEKREFAWMTIQQFRPDRPVEYPFKGWKSLDAVRMRNESPGSESK